MNNTLTHSSATMRVINDASGSRWSANDTLVVATYNSSISIIYYFKCGVLHFKEQALLFFAFLFARAHEKEDDSKTNENYI